MPRTSPKITPTSGRAGNDHSYSRGGSRLRRGIRQGWWYRCAQRGGAPDQNAWFGLVQPPALGLLAPMVVPAETRLMFITTQRVNGLTGR